MTIVSSMVTESIQIFQTIEKNGEDETPHHTIRLDEDALGKVLLDEKNKDCYVSVVSVAGTFRQGKSFLLNFFLRYLRKLSENNGDKEQWLSAEDGPLEGFNWAAGSKRHTTGIHIWPEAFRIKLPSGEKVAIILMDTEGSFDNQSNLDEFAKVFSISTLMSSVQIYNLMRQITQYDLSHLQCFSGYGALIAEYGVGKAFQNLSFLIRDWPNSHEHPYGAPGGEKYLKQVFREVEKNADLKLQVDLVNGLFEENGINCFLLPHPGLKVDSSKFTGNLEDVEDLFKEHVQAFVRTILAPERVVLKTVAGEKITAKELYEYIVKYCENLESEDLPIFQSMFDATVKAHFRKISDEALQLYLNEMDVAFKGRVDAHEYTSYELHELHAKKLYTATKHFEDSNKFKALDVEWLTKLLSEYLEMLKNACDAEFKKFKKINDSIMKQRVGRELLEAQKQKTARMKRIAIGVVSAVAAGAAIAIRFAPLLLRFL